MEYLKWEKEVNQRLSKYFSESRERATGNREQR